jgi:hypothetical protein
VSGEAARCSSDMTHDQIILVLGDYGGDVWMIDAERPRA